MATIKSYTDIEQSRKLAEILPLETADMWWAWYSSPFDNGHYDDFPMFYKPICNPDESTPCWSLVALLATLPNEIITNNRFECHYQINVRKYDGGDNITLYQIAYGNDRGLSGSWHDMINTGEKESLIDACVAIIEQLHELKML